MLKHLAILGSTGSIGVQALEVIRQYPEIRVTVLAARSNAKLLAEQALEFMPEVVVIADEAQYTPLSEMLRGRSIQVMAGEQSLVDVMSHTITNTVLVTMVGFAGLLPTLAAIRERKNILLATKEVLVIAGQLVMTEAQRNDVNILPVDSEHSGLFQCMQGENWDNVEKVFLTASGGPFFRYNKEKLKNVTIEEALKHPNWTMGKKITIDSATLMNKGFEVIEAVHLFSLDIEQVDVLIHPQSIIHAIVQFSDGSLKAQLSYPDMRMPIAYALFYPERKYQNTKRIDFHQLAHLDFYEPDYEMFPCLQFAYEALQAGGSASCVLNAANEVAVEAFLCRKIAFYQIPEIIVRCLDNKSLYVANPGIEDYIYINQITRNFAHEIIQKIS